MDITFNCPKCQQHLVVDESGAGMTVPCPTCGADISIPPKTVTPAPINEEAQELPTPAAPESAPNQKRQTSPVRKKRKPVLPVRSQSGGTSSEELYQKCKDLAYELRVEDAIRARRDADLARAREKGYKFSESFAIQATVQTVVEPAKWAIEKTLQNLTPKEKREIFGALICCLLGVGGHDEVLVVTLGSDLRWPALETWFWKFKKMKYWSPSWELYPADAGIDLEPSERKNLAAEFYRKNLRQPTDGILTRVHKLMMPARRLLLDNRMLSNHVVWLRPQFSYRYGDYDKPLSELESAGFAKRAVDLPVTKYLDVLTIDEVREVQKRYGVKGARSKASIVANILRSAPNETLARDFRGCHFIEITWDCKSNDRYWFEYARAKLLTQTLVDMVNGFNRLKEFQRRPSDDILPYKRRTFRVSRESDCPFCESAAAQLDKMEVVTPDAIPPFHPGCTCSLNEKPLESSDVAAIPPTAFIPGSDWSLETLKRELKGVAIWDEKEGKFKLSP